MPQTGTSDGHAHIFERDAKRTRVFGDHYHRIPSSGTRTGPAVNIRTGQAEEDDSHTHSIPGRV